MIKLTQELKKLNNTQIKEIVQNFNNKLNIQKTLDLIIKYLEIQKKKAFEILKF